MARLPDAIPQSSYPTTRLPAYPIIRFIRSPFLNFFLFAFLAAVVSGCAVESKPTPKQTVIWRHLGAWTGSGPVQTESFTSDTGSLRVQWETKNEKVPGKGTFRVTVHSAISGRPLAVAVDQAGPGRDTSYVHEDPRVFYIVVEAANLDWSVTMAEGLPGTVAEVTKR
jgi:hypothetical protein